MLSVVKKSVKLLLKSRGLTISKIPSYFEMEPEFHKIWQEVKPYTMTSIQRGYALYKAVCYISSRNIPGCIVECGVWRAGSSMLAMQTLANLGDFRHFFLYDTFAGMSEPSEVDVTIRGRRPVSQKWQAKQDTRCDWCYASLNEVKQNISQIQYPKEKITYVKGDVLKTIPYRNQTNIAILRLDTDFYESTKKEMEFMYPLLNQAGILLVDDYGHWMGAKKAIDDYFSKTKETILLNRIDYTGRIGVKY